ncbi:PrsW family intramembrane metalloprotease [Nocardioides marmorisolisilvae]|uniref:Protease PrsW n=1 Tax=Nocardioides marmorisolisilvae TaxID=1542737 RepID=A0A3N0DSY5_9ACTN|nr:PrsW family intramembrane metalloprotease [Nocardioides marmorisolisilvae]RNL78757.1 protease PrsW [Nocardioides marmorisolisilvae]
MRKPANSVAFTVLLGATLLLGAGVMALVLLASGAPEALAVGVVLAAIPVGPVIGCYLWLDRYEPEPRSLLLLGLGWGAFVATSGAIFLQAFDSFAFGPSEATQSVLVAPVTEEAAKGLFILLLLLYRRAELDGILDGIVYAGMVGIGFAFMENILYLTQAYVGEDGRTGGIEDAVGLFVLRGIGAPFAHPFFTAFTGIGIGIAVGSRSRLTRTVLPVIGLVFAIGAHAAWNAALLINGGSGAMSAYLLLMVPAFVVMVAFAVWARRREGVLLARALTDCAGRGLLDASEVPWLTRIPARKAARLYAARTGGEGALDAMKSYQSEAIELGFLHHRFLRGTAPAHYEELGQAHVQRMFELRPRLVWPQNLVGAGR